MTILAILPIVIMLAIMFIAMFFADGRRGLEVFGFTILAGGFIYWLAWGITYLTT